MGNTRFMSRFGGLLLVAALTACGGNAQIGGGDGSTTGGNTTGGNTTSGDPAGAEISSVTLLSSSPVLNSDASAAGAGITITAVVKDVNNNVVPGAIVVFSTADSAEIVVANPAATDENGRATAIVTTGGDPSNRDITLNATAGGRSGSIALSVIGTSLSIDGPRSVQAGTPSTYIVTISNSSGGGIPNRTISIAGTNGTVSSPSVTTDTNGRATVQFTPTSGPTASLEVSALGATQSFDVSVTDDSFEFRPLPAPASATVRPEIPLNADQQVTVRWLRSGAAVSGRPVTLTTTRGRFLQAMPLPTNAQGEVTATLRAEKDGVATAGIATILAVGNDTTTDPDSTPVATLDVEFVATVPAAVEVQADPTVIGTGQQSTIHATVRDADNNLVKNATVTFSLQDVTGGTLSAPSAVTNSQGRASIVYRASQTTSAQDGVKITAAVANAAPSVNDTTLVTVGSQALRIVLGTGNEMVESDDTTRYEMPYTAVVTDAAGNPAPNAELSLTGFTEVFLKGYYTRVEGRWVTNVTAVCANEDVNENGILDPGEDVNGNGALDPANVATVPVRPPLDENGIANFDVSYPQDRGNWVDVYRLRARARVAGTEATETVRFPLPITANDATGEASPPGFISPFGRVGRCDLTDEQVPVIEFALDSLASTVMEGDGVTLGITATKAFSEDVVIPLFSAPTGAECIPITGAGNNFDDYTLPSTITLPAGATSTTVTLNAVDDLDPECTQEQNVDIQLGAPITRNAIIGPKDVATVTIADND